MTIKSKRISAICLVFIVILGLVGSMAYFSDYATTNASGTAGTVAIELDSEIDWLNENGMDILNPGDNRCSRFTIYNVGNKAVDVRTTITLTALDRNGNPIDFSETEMGQSEFDLYWAKDFEYVEGEGSKPYYDYFEEYDEWFGTYPIDVKSINGNTITYTIPEYSLNGNINFAERETIDGISEDYGHRHIYGHYLIFATWANNEWQDCTITMNILVEAKQHYNTEAGWEIVAQKEITSGAIEKNAVYEETVITDLNGNSLINP